MGEPAGPKGSQEESPSGGLAELMLRIPSRGTEPFPCKRTNNGERFLSPAFMPYEYINYTKSHSPWLDAKWRKAEEKIGGLTRDPETISR